MVKKLINWLKNNWEKILIFIPLIIFGFLFHIFMLFSGSIVYFTLFSAFIFLIFSFSVFKSLYKKFLLFVLFLLFVQALIYFISFPKCDENFKIPIYGCECSGIKKQIFGGSECIGKINKCYSYFENPNIKPSNHKENFWKLYNKNKYHPELEVSCDDFPEKVNKPYRQQ